MSWTKESPPDVAKSWSDDEKAKCVAAANAALRGGGKDEDAVFACIAAAGKSNMERVAQFSAAPLDVEIMRAGTWHGGGCPKEGCKFTEADLHDMVTNFQLLKEQHKAPLKRGHSTEVGDIALGWVADLWVEGDRLLAKFADMPLIVRSAIEKKLFRKVSIEAMRGVTHAGKKLKGWVLDAVALLGAEIPAVSGLKDLDAYLASRALAHGSVATFSTVKGSLNEQEHTMDEEMKKRFDAIESRLTASDEKIVKLTDRNKELEAENAKLKKEGEDRVTGERKGKIELNRKAITDRLEKAVKDKLILPAQRETFTKLLKVSDDEAMLSANVADVDELIKTTSGGKSMKFNREEGRNGEQHQRQSVDPGEELHALTQKYMDDHPKTPYHVALERAMASRPDLAVEHIGDLAEEAA